MCFQETTGRVLDKWMCATREEEFIIMQQFLRFGETKSIAQEIILQDTKERQDSYIKQSTRSDSEIKKFIERSNMSMQTLIRPFDVRHLFGTRLPYVSPAGGHLLSPPLGFSTPTSSPRADLRPPLISVSSSSPVTTSPLGRLQTMQPFDFRRESSSPAAMSPGEKQSNSPKSESPQNLSMTSASAHSSPPHTPFTPHKMPDMESPICHLPKLPVSLGAQALILPALKRHQNPEDGVINFSLKEDQESSFYNDRKNKHLRKSCTPIKRNWIPDPNFGTSMIGPNGKKRVLCTACNKTFCDKGALKIHYSAVHLKEMHKCSVEGCTMMFSSRRSRNRHSANPNPKLHMPQKRPKIPEGARLIDDGTSPLSKRQLASPPVMMPSGMLSQSPVNLAESSKHRPFYADPNMHMPVFPTSAKKIKLEHDDSEDDTPRDLSIPLMKNDHSSRENSPGNASLSLVPEHMLQEYQQAIKNSFDDSQDSENNVSESATSTSSPGPQRSQSRRKNTPIRCAQSSDRFAVTEESADARSENVENDKPENDQGKKEQEDDQDDDQDETDKVNENGAVDEKEVEQETSDIEDIAAEKSDGKLVIDDEDYDGEDDEEGIDGTDTGEVLDFAMHMPDDLEGDNLSAVSGQDSNASHGSYDSSDMSKANQDSMSDLDIPVDKENPKQCVSCGKSFLNVFGLKIHYKNVHLKLMHKCKVEGCGASFPSKRSRDRHSSNLNLHRKLLSTLDDHQGSDKADDNQNFRADVIQKLYENQNIDSEEPEAVQTLVNGEADSEVVNEETNLDNVEPTADVNGTNEPSDMDTNETNENGELETSEVTENTEPQTNEEESMETMEEKLVEKVSPNTRKSRRQLSQNDLRKNMMIGDKAVPV